MNRQYLDPAAARPLPARSCRDLRRGLARLAAPTTSRRSARRSTSSASTTTRAAWSRHDPRRSGRSRARPCASRSAALHRDRLGGLPAGPRPTRCSGCTQRYGALPLYVTENGAAFYDPPPAPDGRVDDPLRVALPARRTCAPCATRSRAASTCAATSPGRCSTTSSGRTATRSASALVHVDYPRRSGRATPKASAPVLPRRSSGVANREADMHAARIARFVSGLHRPQPQRDSRPGDACSLPPSPRGAGSVASARPVDRRPARPAIASAPVADDLDPSVAPRHGRVNAAARPARRQARVERAGRPTSGRTPSTHSTTTRCEPRRGAGVPGPSGAAVVAASRGPSTLPGST